MLTYHPVDNFTPLSVHRASSKKVLEFSTVAIRLHTVTQPSRAKTLKNPAIQPGAMLAQSRLMRLAHVCLLIALFFVASNARASLREPAHMSVRDHYEWAVSLANDTKAAVGPVAAERVLKLRLDTPLEQPPEAASELIRICIQERYCKTTELGPTPDGPSELEFDQELVQLVDEYGGQSLDKLYVTVEREKPKAAQTLEFTILVETELTMKMPEFHLVPALELNALDIEPVQINQSRVK